MLLMMPSSMMVPDTDSLRNVSNEASNNDSQLIKLSTSSKRRLSNGSSGDGLPPKSPRVPRDRRAVMRRLADLKHQKIVSPMSPRTPKKQSSSSRSVMKNSCTSRSVSKANRRVRFDVNASNEISSYFQKSERSLTARDCVDTWWGNQEMLSLQQHARSVSDFFQRFRPDYTEAAAGLVARCAQAGANELCLRTDKAIPVLVEGQARGLEAIVVPVLRHRRDHSVKSVLKAQERLRDVSAEQRSHLIAIQYQRSAKYASLFARILADGDALSAAAVQ